VVVDSCIFPHRKWLTTILDGARSGAVIPVWSPLIIAEVNRLLTWLWLKRAHGDQSEAAWKRCSDDSKAWFSTMTTVFRVIDDHPPYEQTWSDEPADAWDIPIWTAATRAQHRFRGAPIFIVTDNLKDGPPKDKHGLQHHRNIGFIHPNDFVALIDAWADLMYTGESRTRSRRSGRSTKEGTSKTGQEEITLLPEVEEFLRIVSARLGKTPEET
jgi:hypothetical protein